MAKSGQFEYLGLDASQFFQESDKVDAYLQKLANAAKKFNEDISENEKKILAWSKAQKTIQQTLSTVDEAGNRLILTVGKLRDAEGELTNKVGILNRQMVVAAEVSVTQNKALREQSDAIAQLIQQSSTLKPLNLFRSEDLDAIRVKIIQVAETIAKAGGTQRELSPILRAVSQDRISDLRGEQRAIAETIKSILDYQGRTLETYAKESEALNRTVDTAVKAAAKKREAEKLASEKAIEDARIVAEKKIAAQVKAEADAVLKHKEFNDLITEEDLRNGIERIQIERNIQAEYLKERLKLNALTNQMKKATVVDDEQVRRTSETIEKITGLIRRGRISVQDAMSIIAQAGKAPTDQLTEAGRQVNALTAQLVESSNRIDREFGKNTSGIANSAKNVSTELKELGTKGKEDINALGRAWAVTSRIFIGQQIHTAVNRLTQAVRNTINETARFQIEISQIRTISQDGQLAFSQWASAVRNLSNQFGAPQIQVANGLYEALSNQVAKGAEATIFMAKAMTFAQVSVSSTMDSVNLLSSVLKSYNLEVKDTERVAAILFKVIDLGRIKASDFANSIGRVTALAAPLGIPIEEIGAAIATITRTGVKPAETLTLITNVLKSLLDPGAEFKKFLIDIGYESGPAAVNALGLEGVLHKVAIAADGAAEKLGELAPEMRTLRGLSGLTTRNAFANFKEDLDQMKNPLADYLSAQQIAIESAGRQYEIEMNKIRNFFSQDFGDNVLKFFTNLSLKLDEDGNKVSGFSDQMSNLIFVVQALAATYASYKLSILAASSASFIHSSTAVGGIKSLITSTKDWAKSLITAQNVLTLAFTAAASLYLYHRKQQEEAIERYNSFNSRLNEAVEKQTQEYARRLNQQTLAQKESVDQQFKNFNLFASRVAQEFRNVRNQQEKIQKQLADTLKDYFEIQIKSINKSVADADALIKKTSSSLESIRQQIAKIEDDLNTRRFKGQVELIPSQEGQVNAIRSEINRLQKYASDKLKEQPLLSNGNLDLEKLDQNLKDATAARLKAENLENELLGRRQKYTQDLERLAREKQAAEEEFTRREDVKPLQDRLDQIDATQRARIKTPGKTKAQRDADAALREEEAAIRLEMRRKREAAGLDKLDSKIKTAETELKSLQEASKALGTNVELTAELTKNQEAYLAALKAAEISREKGIQQAEKELTARKLATAEFQTAYENFSKFKIDPSEKIETQEELDKKLKELKTLADLVKNNPLADAGIIATTVERTNNLENQLRQSFAEEQYRRDLSRVNREKEAQLGLINQIESLQNAEEKKRETERRLIDSALANKSILSDQLTQNYEKTPFAGLSDKGKASNLKAAGLQFEFKDEQFVTQSFIKSLPQLIESLKTQQPVTVTLTQPMSSMGVGKTSTLNLTPAEVEKLVSTALETISYSTQILKDKTPLGSYQEKEKDVDIARQIIDALKSQKLITVNNDQLILVQKKAADKLQADVAEAGRKGFDQIPVIRKFLDENKNAPWAVEAAKSTFAAVQAQTAKQANDLRERAGQILGSQRISELMQETLNAQNDVSKTSRNIYEILIDVQKNGIKVLTTNAPGKATGGFVNWKPTGWDEYPAMLSRKEFIMPEGPSMKYTSILEQMRQGTFTPTVRAFDFGSVAAASNSRSIEIGDINVNISEAGGPIDPIEIGRAISNEIRKGTLSWRA